MCQKKKAILTVGASICWNNLPRGVAEFPLLEVSKMQLDRVPGNLSEAPSPYHKKLEAPPTLGCSVGVSLERRAMFTVLFSRLF